MRPVLVLVGLPGAGKTTAGRRVALRLRVPFADTDGLIEQRTGRTVAQLFGDQGEAAFRRLEEEIVSDAMASPGVLALGGGAVLSAATRAVLAGAGAPVAYLTTTPVLALRYTSNGRNRPLLQGDPAARLQALAEQREPVYQQVATVRVVSGGRPLRYVVDDLEAIVTARTVVDGVTA